MNVWKIAFVSTLTAVVLFALVTVQVVSPLDQQDVYQLFDELTPNRSWKETVTLRGHYVLSQPIVVPNFTVIIVNGLIEGKNMNVDLFKIARKTEIEINGGYYQNAKRAIHMYLSSYVKIEDLNIQNMKSYGVSCSAVNNVDVNHNTIKGFGDDGIAIVDNSFNFRVCFNTVSGAYATVSQGSSGIEIGDGSYNGVVTHNFCFNNVHGINLNHHVNTLAPHDLTVSLNVIYNNTNSGIGIRGAYNILVTENNLCGNPSNIYLKNTSYNVTITYNLLS